MERRNGLIRAKSDRLSSLPDEVLCHVLSFLPTKFSVKTSILAPRYRYLWRDVVNLHFDDDRSRTFGQPKLQISFKDAVNRVMLLRSNSRDINTIRLVIKDPSFKGEHHLLDTWIRYAIARNVQAIDIQLFYQFDDGLPSCLFTCQTLVDLRLELCGCVPDDIFLPNLKKLHLYSCKYCSWRDEECHFQDIISGCPVLEELIIELVREFDMECCVISSPTIKWLTVNFELDGDDDDFRDFKLEIHTPALRCLYLTDCISQHISAGVLNSLVEARISLHNDEVLDNSIYSNTVLELVERLCQVKYLEFLSSHEQFLYSSFATVTSKFINLTKLEFGADWHFLLKILECADNLQVLIIRELDYNLKRVAESQQVPTCLSSHLREVTVDPFGRGSENEFEMVSYILKHGKVLNEVKINAKHLSTDVEKLNALRRISEFERGSQICKLMFS